MRELATSGQVLRSWRGDTVTFRRRRDAVQEASSPPRSSGRQAGSPSQRCGMVGIKGTTAEYTDHKRRR